MGNICCVAEKTRPGQDVRNNNHSNNNNRDVEAQPGIEPVPPQPVVVAAASNNNDRENPTGEKNGTENISSNAVPAATTSDPPRSEEDEKLVQRVMTECYVSRGKAIHALDETNGDFDEARTYIGYSIGQYYMGSD